MKNVWTALLKQARVLSRYLQELANGASYAIHR